MLVACRFTHNIEAVWVQAAIPGKWTAGALSMLDMGRQDQAMVDANNQADQLDLNARASS